MSTTITPSWTDNVSVIAASTLALGGLVEGTLDLRGKNGAFLQVQLGRKGATAPATAAAVRVYRVLNNGAAPAPKGQYAALASQTAASNATTVGAGTSAGATSFTVSSATGIVAGDTLCIYDTSYTVLEFVTVSKVSGTTVTPDRALLYAHATSDNVTRVADVFAPVWVQGGSLYAVVADYGAAATGSDMVVRVVAQTYDSDSAA